MALTYSGGYAEHRLPPAIIFEPFTLRSVIDPFSSHTDVKTVAERISYYEISLRTAELRICFAEAAKESLRREPGFAFPDLIALFRMCSMARTLTELAKARALE
jgi:hypothetical protein